MDGGGGAEYASVQDAIMQGTERRPTPVKSRASRPSSASAAGRCPPRPSWSGLRCCG